MNQEGQSDEADGNPPDDGSHIARVIDGNSYFTRSRRLSPIMSRLLDCVLHGVSKGLIRDTMEAVTKRLVQQPQFPDLVLTEDQFQAFERQLKEMEDWEQEERDDAFRFALDHMRRCLNMDPYSLPPLATDTKLRAKYHAELRSAIGYLAIAWQFRQGLYGDDLIISHADFVRAHPARAPGTRFPPHA